MAREPQCRTNSTSEGKLIDDSIFDEVGEIDQKTKTKENIQEET